MIRLTYDQGGRQGETVVNDVVRVETTTDGGLTYTYRLGTGEMRRGVRWLDVPVVIEEVEELPSEVLLKPPQERLCCKGCSLPSDVVIALTRIESARSLVEQMANWRERAHEYDDDMGYDLRDFDDEDWDMIEREAQRALDYLKDEDNHAAEPEEEGTGE